jgi:hypothetical protein
MFTIKLVGSKGYTAHSAQAYRIHHKDDGTVELVIWPSHEESIVKTIGPDAWDKGATLYVENIAGKTIDRLKLKK